MSEPVLRDAPAATWPAAVPAANALGAGPVHPGVPTVGLLHPVAADGTASGWCWSPAQPALRRAVALLANNERVATALCDQPLDALVAAGVGDGRHAFRTRIPRDLFPAEAGAVAIRLQDIDTAQFVGAPVLFSYPASRPSAGPALRAYLDHVGEEGLVSGWCWDPAQPARRVRLEVRVDGEPVGIAIADAFRGDLRDAGIGDGAHAFSFLLPWEVVASRSLAHVGLGDADTGATLHASAVFRRQAVLPVEERLRELERQVRLLAARLGDAETRAGQDAAVTRGLLATVGAFFTRLAETPPDAVPFALVPSLAGLLDSTAASLAPFSLEVAADPAVTLCVDAAGSAAQIHACLHAVHLAGLDRIAELVLIDDGATEAACLLPSLVQNLRLWRLLPGQSLAEARNRAVLAAGRPYAAFLSAGAAPGADWLAHALDTFRRRPDCAVLGAKLVRADGTIQAAGLLPDRHGRLADFAHAEHELAPHCDRLAPVAAVRELAMVVRGDVFASLGGFDTGFADAGAACVDLCFRCWQAGRTVLYQPAAALAWHDPAGQLEAARQLDPAAARLLAERWPTLARRGWPRPLGRALLLDAPAGDPEPSSPGPDDPALRLVPPPAIAAALLACGYDVSAATVGLLDGAQPHDAALRRIGVTVLRAPFQQSVSAALAADPGYALILATPAAAAALPPGRVRVLAPGARLVLLLDAASDRLAADPSAGAARARLLATVADTDHVLARTRAGAAGLRVPRLRAARPPCRGPEAAASVPATLGRTPAEPDRRPGIGHSRAGPRAARSSTPDAAANGFARDLRLILAALGLPVASSP